MVKADEEFEHNPIPPSEHPDRVEVLTVTALDPHIGLVMMVTLLVGRDNNGRANVLLPYSDTRQNTGEAIESSTLSAFVASCRKQRAKLN